MGFKECHSHINHWEVLFRVWGSYYGFEKGTGVSIGIRVIFIMIHNVIIGYKVDDPWTTRVSHTT